jgi:hypothetical protein
LDRAIQRSSFSSFLDLINPSIKDAMAATLCPTFMTAAGTGAGTCSVYGVGNNVLFLDYGTGCQFANGTATWAGSQMLTVSAGTVSCGSFPAAGGYSGNLTRAFPPTTTRTDAAGIVVTIDTSGIDPGYAFTTPSSPPAGGAVVSFTNGTRTELQIPGVNLTATSAVGTSLYNHSLTTTGGTPITMSNGVITAGSVLVYHNLLQVLGTTTFNGVTFSSGCCTPTAGTVTTIFSAVSGTTPTAAGALFVGRSETLTFTSCGNATYTGPGGSPLSVALNQCF